MCLWIGVCSWGTFRIFVDFAVDLNFCQKIDWKVCTGDLHRGTYSVFFLKKIIDLDIYNLPVIYYNMKMYAYLPKCSQVSVVYLFLSAGADFDNSVMYFARGFKARSVVYISLDRNKYVSNFLNYRKTLSQVFLTWLLDSEILVGLPFH